MASPAHCVASDTGCAVSEDSPGGFPAVGFFFGKVLALFLLLGSALGLGAAGGGAAGRVSAWQHQHYGKKLAVPSSGKHIYTVFGAGLIFGERAHRRENRRHAVTLDQRSTCKTFELGNSPQKE